MKAFSGSISLEAANLRVLNSLAQDSWMPAGELFSKFPEPVAALLDQTSGNIQARPAWIKSHLEARSLESLALPHWNAAGQLVDVLFVGIEPQRTDPITTSLRAFTTGFLVVKRELDIPDIHLDRDHSTRAVSDFDDPLKLKTWSQVIARCAADGNVLIALLAANDSEAWVIFDVVRN